MPDELTLLRAVRESVPLAPELEEQLRRELVRRLAAPARVRPRWPVRAALAVAAVAVLAVAGLLAGREEAPSVAERAYAAVNPPTGIMHFVVDDRGGGGDLGSAQYEEYWINLADPRQKRLVESNGRRLVDQIVLVTRPVPHGSAPWPGNPRTSIIEAPADPATLFPGRDIRAGQDPAALYREALRSGSVVSEKDTTWAGRKVYELVIRYKPPYRLIGGVLARNTTTQTFVVGRKTYFPLAMLVSPGPSGWGWAQMYFPVFEILPDTAQNRKLLEPAKNPQPYRP